MNVTNKNSTVQYPEHEKLSAIKDKSQAIGEFIEWLQNDKGVTFMINQPKQRVYLEEEFEKTIRSMGEDSPQARALLLNNFDKWEWQGGYTRLRKSITDLLEEYFDIDGKKIESEKRMMLDSMKKQ